VGHLDEFCFRRKRKRCFDYVRNSYRDEFFDFSPRSFSHALPHTSSHALSQFALRLDALVTAHVLIVVIVSRVGLFFSTRGSHTHFEPRHLDGSHFPCHGSCPTQPNCEVQRTVKSSSGLMVKC
jgi:hypothetical protein